LPTPNQEVIFVKKLLVLVVALVAIALLLPISTFSYKPVEAGKLTALRANDPHYGNVAKVLEQKCAGCHVEDAALPFYAGFPIAKPLIQDDVRGGLKHLNMVTDFSTSPDSAFPEAALAKLELVVRDGTMPPQRYLMMHWNGALTDTEKQEILDWVAIVRKANYTTDAAASFENEPVQPLPLSIELDPDRVALGDKLYHDPRLSGDDTISCATCHDLSKGGTDQAKSSTGIGGQVGPINSPTTLNSGFFVRQFWDGRAGTLEEQAAGPVHNPIEMGSNWEQVIPKLKEDKDYVAAFKNIYGDEGITGDNIVDAIATFERSLITPNSRFDQFLRGDAEALTAEEKEGWEIFKASGCVTCHVGQAMGGQSFERMGLKDDYFAERGNVQEVDKGLANFTKKDDDLHKFKVPSLRNIAITYPYFHDGETVDLKDAVKIMSRFQEGDEFTDSEAEKVTAFLKTLTGELNGQPLE
jgi:cytochrome c peroxidase